MSNSFSWAKLLKASVRAGNRDEGEGNEAAELGGPTPVGSDPEQNIYMYIGGALGPSKSACSFSCR